MTLRFISLQRRIVLQGHNSQGRCVTGHGITLAQWTSQSNGSTARRPNAPALAQMVASARILSHVPETEDPQHRFHFRPSALFVTSTD
jgi:hypothetical protein